MSAKGPGRGGSFLLAPNPGTLEKGKIQSMSTPEQQITETTEQRVWRELSELRETGVLKKELPTITRSTFHALPLRSQAEFMRAGGRFTDDPKPALLPMDQIPAGHILKSKFDAKSPAEKMDFCKAGGRIVDDAEYVTPKTEASGSVITRAAYRDLDVREQARFLDAGGTVTD
jgi:hypothetical protein